MMTFYSTATKRFPLLSKCISAGILFGIGDTASQWNRMDSNTTSFDWKRLASFSSYAAIWYAPTQHYWFVLMENYVASGARYAAQPMLQAFTRVTVHSMIYAPFSILSLFTWMAISKNQTREQLRGIFSPDVIFPVWMAGASFWIPTMMGIYRFVPIHNRVFITSAANVAWSCYLSYKSNAHVGTTSCDEEIVNSI
jgi:hypothetical protein